MNFNICLIMGGPKKLLLLFMMVLSFVTQNSSYRGKGQTFPSLFLKFRLPDTSGYYSNVPNTYDHELSLKVYTSVGQYDEASRGISDKNIIEF